jgi:hypothetical protein
MDLEGHTPEAVSHAFLKIKDLPITDGNLEVASKVLPYILKSDTHLYWTINALDDDRRHLFHLNLSMLFYTCDIEHTDPNLQDASFFLSYLMSYIAENGFRYVDDHKVTLTTLYLENTPGAEQICEAICKIFTPWSLEDQFFKHILGQHNTPSNQVIALHLLKQFYPFHWGFLTSTFPNDSSDEEDEEAR